MGEVSLNSPLEAAVMPFYNTPTDRLLEAIPSNAEPVFARQMVSNRRKSSLSGISRPPARYWYGFDIRRKWYWVVAFVIREKSRLDLMASGSEGREQISGEVFSSAPEHTEF